MYMDKFKIAKIISTLTNPPIICIPLFFIICLCISENIGEFIVLEVISLIFASILPMVIILFWAKRLGTDTDISNRTDRFIPMIIGIISYFIGFLICLLLKLDNFLTILLLCYALNTGIVLIITTKWKISVHTTGLSGPVGALILLIGPFGALFGILYPVLIFSRVLLNKHTLAQAICGAVQGFFLTVIEIYLFVDILHIPLGNLISLDYAIFYILAIIVTPIILGFLSYLKPSGKLFALFEIIAFIIFLLLMPFDVFIIFTLISLTSILISLYAGDDFIWYKVLTSS